MAPKNKKMKLVESFEESSNSYLQQREANIQQNNMKLISLGLPPMQLSSRAVKSPIVKSRSGTHLSSPPAAKINFPKWKSTASDPSGAPEPGKFGRTPIEHLPSPTAIQLPSRHFKDLSTDRPCNFVETPSYEQIFIPPPTAYKEPRKLYGKELLRQHFYSQYLTLMTNRRIIKGWLTDFGLFANPPNLRDAKVSTALRSFVDDKKSELAALNFGSTTYKLQSKEIYDIIKEMLHYARRKLKLKDKSDQGRDHEIGNNSPQTTSDNRHLEESEEQVEVETIEKQALGSDSMATTSSHLQLVPSQEPFKIMETEMQFGSDLAEKDYDEVEHGTVEQQVLLDSSDLQPTRRISKRIHDKKSRAPPLPHQHSKIVLPLSSVEKLIMESIGYNDVDEMYSSIRVFMKQENIMGKKNIFTNINGMTDEEAVRSVGKFLMQG